MNWDAFTPLSSGVGGILIGLSAVWMLAAHGRIAGISGIFGSLVTSPGSDAGWRVAFVSGLMVAGVVGFFLAPAAFAVGDGRSAGVLIAAGLLVGFGSRLGSGCTSGHGVCGVGRLSQRSLVATATFMATGALTVWLYSMIGGSHG